ncbi:MAG: PaaI family thioesterase [Phaeodactylibacter sp.]|nr:PaaI family thioesterase [Phaeodactylibacter sp.]MCB9301488.1 PaaI family thioesterase [Lewinellaceae bacterium]
MNPKAFQDNYPDALSHCYGCGRLNEHGHQLKSYWDGAETIAHFTPQPYHTAIPGYVYGGLIASLIDCHATGTASAAAARAAGLEMSDGQAQRFVTAALKVDFLKPTPIGVTLELRGKISELKDRKVVVEVTLYANGVACARGEVVCVRMPEEMLG